MRFARVKTMLVLWCAAEVVAFLVAVEVVGLGWTLLAELAATVLGFALLRRAGAAAMFTLRATLAGRPMSRQPNATGAEAAFADGALADGGLAVTGALALVLPGLLSDAYGLTMLVPGVRRRLAGALGGRLGFVLRGMRVDVRSARQPARGETIDLPPDQWRSGNAPRVPLDSSR